MVEEQKPIVYKIILIGDSNVGKSCLLQQICDQRFEQTHKPTIGCEFGCKVYEINNQKIKLQVWDTAGLQSYKAVTRSYFRGALAIFIVFDFSNLSSFQNLESWVQDVEEYSVLKILVGNKTDLLRTVSTDQAKSFAQQHSFLYFETAANDYNSVENLFKNVAEKLVYNQNDNAKTSVKQEEQVPQVPESQKQNEEEKTQQTQTTEKEPVVYKLLITGSFCTGKSNIMLKYVDNIFQESYFSTIGVDFKIKLVNGKNNEKIKLQIWDTAGQERFQTITSSYYKSCQGIFQVFSIDSKESFEKILNWDQNLIQQADSHCIRILVGNKIDDQNKRQVEASEAQQFAAQNGFYQYIEVSAKTGENIEKLFNAMIEGIQENKQKKNNENPQIENQNQKSLQQQLQEAQQELQQVKQEKAQMEQNTQNFLDNLNVLIEKLTKFEISAQEFAAQVKLL